MGVFQHKAGKCWTRAEGERAYYRQIQGPEIDDIHPPETPRYLEPLLGVEIVVYWQPPSEELLEN